MSDLFNDIIDICPGMYLLPGFADTRRLRVDLNTLLLQAPLRRMQTSRGFYMSVKTTNCGSWGWVSDRRGYRYSAEDPDTGKPWPAMPKSFVHLASLAAAEAGFAEFTPDACLINYYEPGTQMGAHQDKDESDFDQPIVSVSLGIEARFFVIGPERQGRSVPVDLSNGDVLVFGGPARKHYHGVRKLKPAIDPEFGAARCARLHGGQPVGFRSRAHTRLRSIKVHSRGASGDNYHHSLLIFSQCDSGGA